MSEWIIVGAMSIVAIVALLLCWAQRDEIRYLRTQLEQRRDHERRVERVTNGLHELPYEPPKKVVIPPSMQIRIDEAISAWGSPVTQDQKRADVQAWLQEGRDIQWIVTQLEDELSD